MDTTMDGYPLGEEVIDQFRTGGPAGIVVSTRLDRGIADRLLDVSEATGKKVSELVGEAVLSYLNTAFAARDSHLIATKSGLTDHTGQLSGDRLSGGSARGNRGGADRRTPRDRITMQSTEMGDDE